MSIDWFTVGAQLLNFLILMWLLKRFLYKPILTAIDARGKRIAAERADADAKRAEAQQERDDFHTRNTIFDEQRSALLSKARDEANAERERLLDQARKEVDSLRTAQENALRSDQVRLGNEITRVTTEEVFGIARKTLADLATVSLEERLADVFIRRLRAMDGTAKEALAAAFKTSSEPPLVRSTYDLPTEQRAAIQNALTERFSTDMQVRFETAGDVLCGIELTANGQKIAWSIGEYLKSLKQKVDALLDAQAMPVANATPSSGTTPVVMSGAVAVAK